ncbi:transmembrane protein, putative [Bodo saltans]|uniref:Transmembrane protein, putative n=1 Tax=Bodo saltans TaxID=75058 RepID=A0A0S4JU16_BODSA|nr:transmembrane protein, putative [Bodo saltans]|eukprot:CUG93716.1 transmembrane protein, putative [Bodo saltans]
MAGDDSMIILPPAVHLLFPPSPFASHPPSLFAFSGGCGFSHSVKANSPSPPQSPRSSVSPLSLFVLSVFFVVVIRNKKERKNTLFSCNPHDASCTHGAFSSC